ncbi:uncharacterized protein At4g22758-like [Herrania umbratica]|uniref:Uncharacterized protein At4g22758-like n=1 Tax=Herrania umbratica TaxID=108875 RepID=A0A6J1BBF5_9ROSI|nr:uncharacterized protein At4g22758-like [Herrania umbratica]
MMKRNVHEKMMPQTQKKKGNENKNVKKSIRFLITINVLGSAGPLRFLVNQDDLVAAVIDVALKSYAREGRLPVLGLDPNKFLLYCANAGSDALSPWEKIGSQGGRNFVLCKKQVQPQMTEARSEIIKQKGSGWKAWLNKSFSFKILSH